MDKQCTWLYVVSIPLDGEECSIRKITIATVGFNQLIPHLSDGNDPRGQELGDLFLQM